MDASSVVGALVLVSNGVYATGGRAVGTEMLVNRVAVDKPLTVRSVNGPQFTLIQGYQVPGTTNGDAAIRCVYLASGASLSGFTLTNGATRASSASESEQCGGGLRCESGATASNCALVGNSAAYGGGAAWATLDDCTLAGNTASENGGGATDSTLNNCTVAGNSAQNSGGGGHYCTFHHCTLSRNSATRGGGAAASTLHDCILNGNVASIFGGGAHYGTLDNSVLTGNSAESGGGARRGTLNNCMLTGNSALWGGGASYGTLNNCTLTGNSATSGGGASGGTLNNCTVTGNSAQNSGGGAYGGSLNNSIVHFNTARLEGPNHIASTLNYCCTTPMPPDGTGNITVDPQLAGAGHLSATSPCRGAGSAAFASGTDIDGEPWAAPPSIGCDEFHAGAITGPLQVAISSDRTRVATGFAVNLTAQILGHPSASVWDFGDGTVVTNQPYAAHAWNAVGDYPVALRAYNESWPDGVMATVIVSVSEGRYYVNAANSNPLPPYTSWATAATNIQDAVDAAAPGGTVLVTDGTYSAGGRAVDGTMTNRVAVYKPLTLRSVNGPQVTIIRGSKMPGREHGCGDGAIRCVYLAEGASLSGFTLTNGATRTAGDWEREQCGGGAWCESAAAVVSNCVVVANSASGGGGAFGGTLIDCTLTANWAGDGGGARGSWDSPCTLNKCKLIGNSAGDNGGGACEALLHNCTLTGNSARSGGGAADCTLNNCTLSGNSAVDRGGGVTGGTLRGCALTGNSAANDGGGAYGGALYNCTLTHNSAGLSAGGAAGGTLRNCIVYFNRAPSGANYDSGAWGEGNTFEYSCTTPLPRGPGNIDVDPQLVAATHLSPASPCLGAGHTAYAEGVDIDGEPWADPPAMGADQPGPTSGSLSVWIEADFTYVAVGCEASFVARNTGPVSQIVWDFGDGTFLTNQAFPSHAWSALGTYEVRLTGYNDSHAAGVTATRTMRVGTGVSYVNASNPNPVPPYETWETAATNIQDAIAAGPARGLVLVTNGTYRVGTVATNGLNRVALTNVVSVRSVNGPEVTLIEGEMFGVRCAYVGNGSVLSGFTLTSGTARSGDIATPENYGGAVWCEVQGVVTNCVLSNNWAVWGGGAYQGTLQNCTLTRNRASYSGGGAYRSTLYHCRLTDNLTREFGGGANTATLYNCELTSNSAEEGGAAAFSTLHNCVLTRNSAHLGGGGWASTLNNCLVTGNSAERGGGAVASTLYNCTVTDNSASVYGGGASSGTLYNCIVCFNSATTGGNYSNDEWGPVLINYSCISPLPMNGVGNIDADPLFVNAGAGDFRLRPDSPCIDAGTDLTELISTDILGLARPLDGNGDGVARVDMGAYEFDPYRFEPTLSVSANGFEFTVKGEPGKSVRIEVSRDLASWEFVATVPIPANGQTLIDPAAATEPFLFYRAVSVP